MARAVTTIPATLTKFASKPIATKKRRVAGYARVSTDKDEQFASYEAQVNYYTNYIKSHRDWEFVDVFTDEGISGTHTTNREGFNRMIAEALAGQIDLIITKSVSRFARNTVDTLTTIRKLKENGVECYFEKENIWTFDSKGEVLLTIMSSLAQEESRSLSENVTWGWRKRFADGKVSMAYKHFLGYEKGPDGNPVVDEEQARTVRYIFKSFIEGKKVNDIAKDLICLGYKTATGLTNWNGDRVTKILRNEKYTGNAILQKTYKPDLLSKRKANNGEVQKYYVTDSHPAIISKEEFDRAQQEIQIRKSFSGAYSSRNIFSGKIMCGDCGKAYGSKIWHSNDQYRKVVWQCNNKFKNKCTTPSLSEDQIKEAAVNALNQVITDKDNVMQDLKAICGRLTDTTELKKQIANAQAELEEATTHINGYQRGAKSTDEFKQMQERYNALESKLTELTKQLEDVKTKKHRIQKFNREVKSRDKLFDSFDEELWRTLVDHMTIYSKDKITVTLRCGYKN